MNAFECSSFPSRMSMENFLKRLIYMVFIFLKLEERISHGRKFGIADLLSIK